MRPQRIEQRLTLGHLKADNVSVRTTPKKERLASGGRLSADQWVVSPNRFSNVCDCLVSLTEHSGAVGGCVMHRHLVLGNLLQICGQSFVGREHIGKIS